MALSIIEGKQPGAQKVVIYGPEGIGKSTLASKFPSPLFIDTEGSTKQLDVRRLLRPTSWAMLQDQVKQVLATPGICRTLVIDTADWAEQLCTTGICNEKKLSGIEDMGYGKGYVYLEEEFGRLLNRLDDLVYQGVHVVITAHAQMRKFEQPDELGAYDRWELKLQKKTAALLKEWADTVLFANYKTVVVNVDGKGAQKGKNKAQGGKRVMYAAHNACWDAKNRAGLPDEMPMDYAEIAPYIDANTAPASTPAPAQRPDVRPSTAREDAASLAPTPEPEPVPAPSVPAETAGDPPNECSPAGPVPAKLAPLLKSADVSEYEVREVISDRQGVFPMGTPWEVMDKAGFVDGWVLKYWDQIVEAIRSNPNRVPF